MEAKAGSSLSACFQCHKCAAGCPLAAAFDLRPDQLIRHVQLGQRERVLRSATIWLCAGCATCATRCPNGVELPAVMDALKQMALAAGTEPPRGVRGVALMQRLFLEDVARRGRVHELSLIARYKLVSGGLADDLALGWQMLRRGKLRLLPPRRIKGRDEVRRLLSEERRPGAKS